MSSLDFVLETERLVLRPVEVGDAEALRLFHLANAVHLAPWEPPPPADWETPAFWRRSAERARRYMAEDRGRPSLLVDRATGALVGMANLSAIERGPFENARLGYKLGAEHQGRGLMREALEALVDHCFEELGLHRLEANHMPENIRSALLLDRLGFRRKT